MPISEEEMASTRKCSRCHEVKPLDDFHRSKATRDGRNNYCKPCTSEFNKGRKRTWSHERRILEQYNLTKERFDEILAAQGGVCAICGTDDPGRGQRWHVDHDHACCPDRKKSCGKCIRGLLCTRCNPMLGFARDQIDVLQSAVKYLEGSHAA